MAHAAIATTILHRLNHHHDIYYYYNGHYDLTVTMTGCPHDAMMTTTCLVVASSVHQLEVSRQRNFAPTKHDIVDANLGWVVLVAPSLNALLGCNQLDACQVAAMRSLQHH